MNLRKAALTGLLALAAVAFAAPSMASAEQGTWLHNHEPILENETISFHGTAGFGAGGVGGTTCTVSGDILATPTDENPETTTGHVTRFTIGTHKECASQGLFAPCEIESATATNGTTGKPLNESPLPVHIKTNGVFVHNPGTPEEVKTESTHLVLTDLTIDTKYTHPDADCKHPSGLPITGNVLHFSEVTLFDEDDTDATTVNTLDAAGSGTVTLLLNTSSTPAGESAVAVTPATSLTLLDENTWGFE